MRLPATRGSPAGRMTSGSSASSSATTARPSFSRSRSQGLGGVGKTQIAIEYVHRFKTDYDLVWWVDCGQPQFIDASLVDLGASMQDAFGISIPPTSSLDESARQVLKILDHATPRAALAAGLRQCRRDRGGQALHASRRRPCPDHLTQRGLGRTRPGHLPVEVFTRAESVAHLQLSGSPSITAEEADQVAEVLGDLPLAVATAGAWLAETSFTVSEYLLELERQAPTNAVDQPARRLPAARLADLGPVAQPAPGTITRRGAAIRAVLRHGARASRSTCSTARPWPACSSRSTPDCPRR